MPKSQSLAASVLVVGAAALAACALRGHDAPVRAAQNGSQTKTEPVKKEIVAERTIRDLIKQLGDDSYDVREAAVKRLAAIGEPALKLLQKEALESKDAEVRLRADALMQVIGQSRFSFISLLPKANLKLAESLGSGLEGNNLASLPTGKQNLAKKTFQIENGLIHLTGAKTKDKPAKVEGIQVNQKLAKLHILHGTCFGAGMPGDLYFVADDTLIGEYKIHFEDKTTALIPIVYGKDVRDWIDGDSSKGVTRSSVGWEGSNDFVAGRGTVRLYVTSWENPSPRKRISKIDFQSTNTLCSPFCVALSSEPVGKEDATSGSSKKP